MEQLQTALRQVDDDYLTGLSNKGILKRAYKDLAEEAPAVVWQDGTAKVTLQSETCEIKNLLGESSCSCPSSSICRHVVTAILWLKNQMDQEGESAQGVHSGQNAQDAPSAQSSLSNYKEQENRANEGSTEIFGEAAKRFEENAQTPREECMNLPLERLKRACGSRRFQTFLSHVKSGELPELAETSIVTVEIPWEQVTVRLLSPLEYSTCTCHSKELCGHKAQALLTYQLKAGKISLKDLEAAETPEIAVDMEHAKEAAGKVREQILAQFEMGLSRQSREVEESLERLAIICHRAQLADFESRLREAASDYRQYFQRSAAFRIQELMNKLMTLFQLAQQILDAKADSELTALAGSFRSDYVPVGKLHLTGMGARSFSSKTGYEGEIYYFLETAQKKWYTWTDARPVFYEGTRKKPGAYIKSTAAPWGLTCSREQLAELEFELTNARTAIGERLSVSQDTRGELLGPRNLEKPEIREIIYGDYEQLLQDFFGMQQNYADDGLEEEAAEGETVERDHFSGEKRRERLVLVQAFGWEEPSFDFVSQRFSWGIHDRKGRTLFISLRYTKAEQLTVTMLERLEQRLKRQEGRNLLFLGGVYLEDGRLCLYPIEFYREVQGAADISVREPSPPEDIQENQENTQENIAEDAQEDISEVAQQDFASGTSATPYTFFETMEQYRQEAVKTLSDLFASGLFSVQEDVLSALSLLAEDGRQLGLSFAAEGFTAIHDLLASRRHGTSFRSEAVIDAIGRISRYLKACDEKLSFDRARSAMGP